jgi:hypothetical protein
MYHLEFKGEVREKFERKFVDLLTNRFVVCNDRIGRGLRTSGICHESGERDSVGQMH